MFTRFLWALCSAKLFYSSDVVGECFDANDSRPTGTSYNNAGISATTGGLLGTKINESSPSTSSPLPIERMNIQFTCNVCGTRNNKYFSKVAYKFGTVIIQCDGCGNHHVIADNLGWIKKMEGKRNIEEVLAERNLKIRKGSISNVTFLKKQNKTYTVDPIYNLN